MSRDLWNYKISDHLTTPKEKCYRKIKGVLQETIKAEVACVLSDFIEMERLLCDRNVYKMIKKAAEEVVEGGVKMKKISKGGFEKILEFIWEYLSTEYGTTKDGAMKMINEGYGRIVASKLEKFSGLDKEFAIKMINEGYGKNVADKLEKFSGLDKEFAMYVIRKYNETENEFMRQHMGHGDSTYGECVGVMLCESIMKNADKISGLDKEFIEEYVKFGEYYINIQSTYSGYSRDKRVRYNSLKLLADNIGYIEGIDVKTPEFVENLEFWFDLLDHRKDKDDRNYYNYSKDMKGKYWIKDCSENEWILENFVNVVKNVDMKIPYFVWRSVGFNYCGILECLSSSRFDCAKFFSRLDGLSKKDVLNVYKSSFQEPSFGIIFDYLKVDNDYGITLDDLLNSCYGYYSFDNVCHILENTSKEYALRYCEKIFHYVGTGSINQMEAKLAKFDGYLAAHPELGIVSEDLLSIYNLYKRFKKEDHSRGYSRKVKDFEEIFPKLSEYERRIKQY